MATIDEKAMNGADLKRFAALIKKTASQSAHGMMSYTDKAKLDGIAAGAEVNVQADWNVTDPNSDAFVKNKPTIDSALSSTSTNAVQNKVVTTEVNKKANTEDLASSASGKGAAMVGYGSNGSVKDALDEVYTLIENAKGTFEVTVTGTEGSYTADKTIDECIAAYNAGDLVVFKKELSSRNGWEKWIICYTQIYNQQNLRTIQAYNFSFVQQGKRYSDGTLGSKLVASQLSYTEQLKTSLNIKMIETEEDLYFGKLSNGKWYEFVNGSYSGEVTRLSASILYIDETANKIYRWSSSGGFQELTVTVDNALSTTSENPVQNKVVKAALDTKVNTTDLASVTEGGEGAGLVGYGTKTDGGTTTNVTVKDALDEIYESIGDGGDLATRVTALEEGKQDKLTQGTNITISNNTISAKDEKVNQTASSENADIPMLLANGATPSNGGAKYDANLKYNPSTNTLKLGKGTLTATDYSGTAAQATADGSGNNIVNTYATKAALDALTQKWTGQFVVLKSTGDTAQQYTALNNILAAIVAGQTPAAADLAKLDLGYIYLLENGSGINVYDEYIKVATGTSTYSVEKIGTTDAGVDVVSLTDAEIDSIWANPDAA